MIRYLLLALLGLLSLTTELRAQSKPVQFTARKEKAVLRATTQTVAIRVTDFTNVTTVQFTLQWPTSVFQFTSVSDFGLPDLDPSHFNTALAASGKLTFSWDDLTTTGQSLADGTVIFKLNFNVTGTVPAGSLLELTATPTPMEVTQLLKTTSVLFNNENLAGCDCN